MNNNRCVHKKVITGEVVWKKQIAAGHFQMGILCPYVARNAAPGQFILVRANISKVSYDPLLHRPLAVYNASGDVFEILVKVVGSGTRMLSEKKVGDNIDIIGPLGNRFPESDGFQTSILVAGGMGIAGLMRLASFLKGNRIIALIGASTREKIVGDKDLMVLGAEIHIATEDGSAGYRGKVTELLEEILSSERSSSVPLRIFSCGPTPMLKVIAEIAKEYKIPAYVSLEERMACGVGACMGCVCQVASPDGETYYKTVCADGPVFDAREIVWK